MCVFDVDMVVCMSLVTCVDVMVILYVYDVGCNCAGGCGMSHVYMLKSVGERMLP